MLELPRSPSRTTYHHGNLREVLIAAAVQLIEEGGVESLSVREAAKRAGVSPGAPFRHFSTRTALLTAVAEQATQRLRASVETSLLAAAGQPAMARFAAIGHAYLTWARDHPTHFRVISERQLIDYESSQSLGQDNAAIRQHMQTLLSEACAGAPHAFDTALAQLAARALVYGLARMASDGHFPEWSPKSAANQDAMNNTLDFFIALLNGSLSSH